MNHIEQAIRDAVENDWIPRGCEAQKITGLDYDDGMLRILATYNKTKAVTDYILIEQILLDPLFWQALGKARGWGTEPAATAASGFSVQEWLMYWHSFIDHLAEGKSADEFFSKLI